MDKNQDNVITLEAQLQMVLRDHDYDAADLLLDTISLVRQKEYTSFCERLQSHHNTQTV